VNIAMKNALRTLMRKSGVKRPLERCRCKQNGGIKINFKEI
jgi:hypothetical protein